MKVTLPEFERAGVMVVGDVMLDRYWYGPTSRISPEAPVPVAQTAFCPYPKIAAFRFTLRK